MKLEHRTDIQAFYNCKKRMNLATNNGNTWSDKTVLFGH